MAAILLQLIRQINYADGFEGAFFDADTASATESFGDDGVVAFYAYGFYSTAYHGAVAYAELVAFFNFAFVGV
jgi:hypothetical protein